MSKYEKRAPKGSTSSNISSKIRGEMPHGSNVPPPPRPSSNKK